MQPFFDANARQQTRVLLQNCHAPFTSSSIQQQTPCKASFNPSQPPEEKRLLPAWPILVSTLHRPYKALTSVCVGARAQGQCDVALLRNAGVGSSQRRPMCSRGDVRTASTTVSLDTVVVIQMLTTTMGISLPSLVSLVSWHIAS